MKISFQLPVYTTGIPKGLKKRKWAVGTVDVEIDVHELGEGDLQPLATINFPPDATDRLVRYFHHDEKVYTPVGDAEGIARTFSLNDGAHPGAILSEARRAVQSHYNNGYYNGEKLHPPADMKAMQEKRAVRPRPLETLGLTECNMKSVDNVVSAFEKRCRRLVAVGDSVYMRVNEPVLAVEFSGPVTAPYATVAPLKMTRRSWEPGRRESALAPQAVFRIDEVERLERFCLDVGVSARQLEERTRRPIIVEAAEALSHDTERLNLFAAASRFAQIGWGKAWLPSNDRNVETVFRIVEKRTHEDFPDELGDAMAAVVELHRSGVKAFDSDLEAQVAGHVCAMWENRAIPVDARQDEFRERSYW